MSWLVVWNMAFIFPIILGMSSSQLTNSIIFQRGRYTSNQWGICHGDMTIKHDENTWALTSKPWGFYPQDGDSSLLQMGTEPDKMFFFFFMWNVQELMVFSGSEIQQLRISWRCMVLIGVTSGIFNQFNIAGGCGDEALMIRRLVMFHCHVETGGCFLSCKHSR